MRLKRFQREWPAFEEKGVVRYLSCSHHILFKWIKYGDNVACLSQFKDCRVVKWYKEHLSCSQWYKHIMDAYTQSFLGLRYSYCHIWNPKSSENWHGLYRNLVHPYVFMDCLRFEKIYHRWWYPICSGFIEVKITFHTEGGSYRWFMLLLEIKTRASFSLTYKEEFATVLKSYIYAFNN